jgi:hypothetical protein
MGEQGSPVRLSLAGPQDVGDIVGLLQANEAINGGSLTGHFDRPAVLKTYRGDPAAYLYGSICIDRRERGLGIAEMLFARLKAELPGREGIHCVVLSSRGSANIARPMNVILIRVSPAVVSGGLCPVRARSGEA